MCTVFFGCVVKICFLLNQSASNLLFLLLDAMKKYIIRIPLPTDGRSDHFSRILGATPWSHVFPTPFPKNSELCQISIDFPWFGTQLPEQKKCNLPDLGDKTLWGGEFHRVFFPRFSYKKDICLKQARDTICPSVVRQGEGRPSKPSLDYPPPAAFDGYDYFSWGGGVENGSPAVGDKGW